MYKSTEQIEHLQPNNVEAEEAVLGGILIDPPAIHDVAHLEPSHFYKSQHGHIFRFMRDLVTDGVPIDFVTLQDRLDNKQAAMLAGLMSLAYADIVTGTLITVVMIIACVLYWFKTGGWSGIEAAYAAMGDRPQHMQLFGVFSGKEIINFCLPVFLLVLGDANQFAGEALNNIEAFVRPGLNHKRQVLGGALVFKQK